MRPIDADVLEGACEQLADKLRHDGHKTDAQLLEALAGIVKFCPALDVEPIRRGNWIKTGDASLVCAYRRPLYRCCLCGTPQNYRYKRCPDCGAKMDEAPAAAIPADGCPAVDKGAAADAT